MPAQWYYAIDDQEGGPISAEELKQKANSGELKRTDQVWKEGMPEWVAAGSIKNLCPATSAGSKPASQPVKQSAPPGTRNVAPVTPAGEVRREAPSGQHDQDELEIEAPHLPPPDLHIQPTPAAVAAAADDRKQRRKGSADDEYMDYDEAFELGEKTKKVAAEASRDALAAFKTMLRNPVGGLDEAFAQLTPVQAIAVGVVFAVIFVACCFVSLVFLSAVWSMGLLGIHSQSGFLAFLKFGMLSLLTPLGILAGCAASRAVFKGQGGFPSDVFIGGASLLPLAALILLDGLLGMRMAELKGIAEVFALCTTVLMLYSGSTRIYRIPEAVATVAVPIMLLLALWIPRIVAGVMF